MDFETEFENVGRDLRFMDDAFESKNVSGPYGFFHNNDVLRLLATLQFMLNAKQNYWVSCAIAGTGKNSEISFMR